MKRFIPAFVISAQLSFLITVLGIAGQVSKAPASVSSDGIQLSTRARTATFGITPGLNTVTVFTDTISGSVFNDLGADGARDLSDSALENWKIYLFQASVHIDSTTSDVDGNYHFADLTPGTYTVGEQVQSGWTQTVPSGDGTYTVTIADGQTITAQDFGNTRNSIGRGVVYYDRNANGIPDPGEGGLTGWTINAIATRPENSRTVVSQPGGAYTIDNLVTDSYTISLAVKPNWAQTFPPTTSYPLVVSSVFDTSGFDFGASTLGDSMKFRTFVPESLLVRRAVSHRRASSRWCFNFTNGISTSQVNGLHLVFSNVVDTITGRDVFTAQSRINLKEYEFSGASIANGQMVTICGAGSRYGMRVKRWWWTFNGVQVGARGGATLPITQQFLLATPNTANVRNDAFTLVFSAGLTVGIPRPDARTVYGWAVIPKSLSMYSSMLTAGVTHTATPGGFEMYKGKPFVGRKITLNPVYHNNRLVGDLLTLKLNIAASQIGFTPSGLGELIYEEDSNPLSGLTLNQIALRADSNLTFWVGVPQAVFINLDTVIRKIDSAFSAPLDTFYVGGEVRFTGVRAVLDIPYLRPSPRMAPIIVPRASTFIDESPVEFSLRQNYPNPFNPSTTIQFELPDEALVTLKVYNMLGQEVATLIDHEQMGGGPQEAEFSAGSLASGIYFYRISAEGLDDEGTSAKFNSVRKMLLIK